MKILKNGVRCDDGSYVLCWFDKHGERITITAKRYKSLPGELIPVNGTDISTDYFEYDRATLHPGNPYYEDCLKNMGKGRGIYAN